MSFVTVRAAVATALDGIPGLRSTPYLTDQAVPPAGGGFAMVEFDDIDYNFCFGSTKAVIPVLIIVFAPREQAKASQQFLDTLREPATGIATIESDVALNALVDYFQVQKVLRPTITTVGNVDYLTVEFQCEVVY